MKPSFRSEGDDAPKAKNTDALDDNFPTLGQQETQAEALPTDVVIFYSTGNDVSSIQEDSQFLEEDFADEHAFLLDQSTYAQTGQNFVPQKVESTTPTTGQKSWKQPIRPSVAKKSSGVQCLKLIP